MTEDIHADPARSPDFGSRWPDHGIARHSAPGVTHAGSAIMAVLRKRSVNHAVLASDNSAMIEIASATGTCWASVPASEAPLLDASLVHRRRTGRAVLYYRTPRGDDLAVLT
jgi:hypothetical protein